MELISDAPLTYSDLHYDVFQWDSTLADIGNPIDPPPQVANELTQLLKHYTGNYMHQWSSFVISLRLINTFTLYCRTEK